MDKLYKIIANSLLLILFFGLLLLPIGSMGIMRLNKTKENNNNVLSTQDNRYIEIKLNKLRTELEEKDKRLIELEKLLYTIETKEATQAITGSR